MDPNQVLIWVQIGEKMVQVAATGLAGLKDILTAANVDPAVYDAIDAEYAARIAKAKEQD